MGHPHYDGQKNHQAQGYCAYNESREENVVAVPYTVGDKRTVVIVPQTTALAVRAVRCPRRANYTTCFAVFVSLGRQLRRKQYAIVKLVLNNKLTIV
jgi:hypothetical protein